MKTINVSEETWSALVAQKLDKRLPTLEAVIVGLLYNKEAKICANR